MTDGTAGPAGPDGSGTDPEQSGDGNDSPTPSPDATVEGESEEQEWRFAVDEVGPDGIVEPEREPIEPESPDIENVVFVLLGVVATLALLFAATP